VRSVAAIILALVAVALATGAPAARGKTIQIVIDQAAFAPLDVKAAVGDTSEWINKDIVDHTATAKNGDWHVVVKVGKKATVVLKKAGTVPYYCEYHPNMKAQLIIKK
jgi:plastocyanin